MNETRPMIDAEIEKAFAGIFDEHGRRLAVSGDILFNENGKPDGAEVQLTWNKQRETPVI
jgi:hypothetical protein